jgi:hypothetical protein
MRQFRYIRVGYVSSILRLDLVASIQSGYGTGLPLHEGLVADTDCRLSTENCTSIKRPRSWSVDEHVRLEPTVALA